MGKTLDQVKAEMGEKWLLHPANRVKRRVKPLPDSAGVDVGKTIRREQRRLVAEAKERDERDAANAAEAARIVLPINVRRKP